MKEFTTLAQVEAHLSELGTRMNASAAVLRAKEAEQSELDDRMAEAYGTDGYKALKALIPALKAEIRQAIIGADADCREWNTAVEVSRPMCQRLGMAETIAAMKDALAPSQATSEEANVLLGRIARAVEKLAGAQGAA